MQRILIRNGDIILPNAILRKADLLIEGGKIRSVTRAFPSSMLTGNDLILNARGSYVAPGFIDTHIHGDPKDIFKRELKRGTTAILPALSCSSLAELNAKVAAIGNFIKEDPLGSNVFGVRFEGAFINRLKRGSQRQEFIQPASVKRASSFLKRTSGLLRVITVAPEVTKALPVIRYFAKRGVIVSLGHTDANYRETLRGIDAGITNVTHLFNAMRQIDRREPGAAGAALTDDRVTVEVILDGIHIHPAVFRIVVMSKGLKNICLVTDSVAADIPRTAKREGAVFRLRNSAIAGSALSMNRAVENAVTFGKLTIPEAVRLATLNPARHMGVDKEKGSLSVGKDADVVIFDKKFNVKTTIVQGAVVYQKRSTKGA
ncbi:MAG: N-acetylglucosamine-6-phosphate deacetylase [Candidatus Omnitrophota bacterium]